MGCVGLLVVVGWVGGWVGVRRSIRSTFVVMHVPGNVLLWYIRHTTRFARSYVRARRIITKEKEQWGGWCGENDRVCADVCCSSRHKARCYSNSALCCCFFGFVLMRRLGHIVCWKSLRRWRLRISMPLGVCAPRVSLYVRIGVVLVSCL